MGKVVSSYQSPPHKVIAFLRKGRDKLRAKYAALRETLRTAENQVRAVTKSREAWRNRALAAETELRELKKTARPGL